MSAAATSLPEGLECYKRTDTFTQDTVPKGLLNDHSTKPGVWGLIKVESGSLSYRVTDPRREPFETVLTPEMEPGIVEPTILHHIAPLGSACFHVEFYRAHRQDTIGGNEG
ncbi:DUF1971 domain-containing protein [Sphingomonas sp. ABOLG]|uniref:DUF1971 domain-containing protein n=1 Tax=unclassified Sphingomonas TaxID=196159 RepID=UPI00062195BC|nr:MULTISPECIES: DUF1971 domain-containing protein [unclassified Sphingomonas]KKI21538.1 tellurite resistance protein [Sphingomonas sp. Ag1]RSV13534.1 DUF1971 domain-containing protein [Sphingomonas sp. ABOLG]